MAAPKGHPRWGGRVKGQPNKATAQARDVALAFLDSISKDELLELWQATKAESKSRAMSLFFTALEFAAPKQARHIVSGEDGGAIVVEVRTYGERS